METVNIKRELPALHRALEWMAGDVGTRVHRESMDELSVAEVIELRQAERALKTLNEEDLANVVIGSGRDQRAILDKLREQFMPEFNAAHVVDTVLERFFDGDYSYIFNSREENGQ